MCPASGFGSLDFSQVPCSLKLSIERPLPLNLISCEGFCIWVVGAPSRFSISSSPVSDSDCRPIHNCLQASSVRVVNARTHDCAASAETFGINLSLFLAETRLLRQRADDATGGTASRRARQRLPPAIPPPRLDRHPESP
jgi:hypothetical protein